MLNPKTCTIVETVSFSHHKKLKEDGFHPLYKTKTIEAANMTFFSINFDSDDFRKEIIKPFTLKHDSKLYIHPDCDIPRSKLKESLNIKTTTDYKKADYIVVSDNPLHKNCSAYHFVYYIPYKSISNILTRLKKDLSTGRYIDLSIEQLKDYIGLFEIVDNDIILFYQVRLNLERYLQDDDEHILGCNVYYNPNEFLAYLIYNQDKVIHESQIISMLNNSIVMDETLFNSLSKMFESTDSANITLAMETMANCNYEKSMVYILILIEKYGYQMRYSSTVKHVNFKSLMKYYGFSSYDLERQTIDKIVNRLNANNLLIPENISIIAQFAKEKAQANLSLLMNSFHIKEVEFNETYTK